MAVAGVDDCQKGLPCEQATRDGIQHTVDVVNLATKGNYIGPLVAAVTFVRSPNFSSESKFTPSYNLHLDTVITKLFIITIYSHYQHPRLPNPSTDPQYLCLN
jgi:hypothetical protein